VEVVSEPVGGFWLVVLGFLAVGWGWDGRGGSGGDCGYGVRVENGQIMGHCRRT